MTMRNAVLGFFIVLAGIGVDGALLASNAQESDQTQIEGILDEFMRCLEEKDRESFLSLFIDGTPTWIGATEPIMRAEILARRPDHKGYRMSDHTGFIDWICSSPETIEETFDNVEITHDGAIAAVSFDFTFKDNGEVSNWGKESWHLVKGIDGWKICSVIFTMTNVASNPWRGS